MNTTSSAPPPAAPSPASNVTPAHRVLLFDADPMLVHLIDEWLTPEGWAVQAAPAAAEAAAAPHLVIVDLPYPRRCGGVDSIREVASRHPGIPIIALSPTIFASVQCCGGVSRTLGVACVVAKPTTRDTLVHAVRRALAGNRC